MWKLVIEDDEGRRTVVPLSRDQYSIGRKEGNTIRLTERNVSREHARIFRKQANGDARNQHDGATERLTFVLEDLTSYNGVFVNGLRISHAQDLSHGDLVQIGDYRIVLQDEKLSDAASVITADSKQTLPNSPQARAASLLDRPNRLVMLAGPTPGAEYPLDRERMTVGRAEDASISINHNSVSRLHCEVHALGDGRFEIVDKGSSNGVRVNSAELRRGIVEPGDVIELGDVKFKFVGAGQIFRPTESHQLSLLSDRDIRVGMGARRNPNVLPVAVFLGVVLAGALAAWVWARPRPEIAAEPVTARPSPDDLTVEEARKLCAAGDCDGAHDRLALLPQSSKARTSQEFRDVENRWADQVLARGDGEVDIARRRALYERVVQAMTVEGGRRRAAADKLQQAEAIANAATTNALELPPAPARPGDEIAPAARPEATRGRTALAPEPTSPPSPPASAPPLAAPSGADSSSSNAHPAPASAEEGERQVQSGPDPKVLLKQQLERKVQGGKGSDQDIRLLIATCKELGDRMCVQQARAVQQQRQEGVQ
jgi:pSer/pThr/pTyr-binding forkhead associated (FHA) protein